MSLPWKPNPGVTEDEALAIGGALIKLALAHKEAIAVKIPSSPNPGGTVENVLFVIADMFQLSPDLVRPGEGLKRKRIMEKVMEDKGKKVVEPVVAPEEPAPKKKAKKPPAKKDKEKAEAKEKEKEKEKEKVASPATQAQNSTAPTGDASSNKSKPSKSVPSNSTAPKPAAVKNPAPKKPSTTAKKVPSGSSTPTAKARTAVRDPSAASSALSGSEDFEVLNPGPSLTPSGAKPFEQPFAPSYWQSL